MADCGCSSSEPIVVSTLSQYLPSGSGGSVTSISVQAPPAGFQVSPATITTSGTFVFVLSDDLGAIEALGGTGFLNRTGVNTWALSPVGTVTSHGFVAPAAGLSIAGANPVTTAGVWTFALSNDLAALEGLAGTGYAKRTGVDTWILDPAAGTGTVTSVGLIQPAAGITVTPSGANPITTAGNFTLGLANDLAAIEALAGTGYARRTAVDTWQTDSTIPNAGLTNSTVTIGSTPVTLGGTITLIPGLTGITLSSGQALIPNGTAATPGIGGTADPNTGLNWTGADVLQFVTAGLLRLYIDGSGNLTSDGGQIRGANGSAAVPSFSHVTDIDTGVSFPGGDQGQLVAGGLVPWQWSTSGLFSTTSGTLQTEGTLLAGVLIVPMDVDYSIPNNSTRSHINNTGAAALVIYTLPPASAQTDLFNGKQFTVSHFEPGQEIRLQADGTDVIHVGPIETIPGGYVSMLTPGTSLTVQSIDDTNWYATTVAGSVSVN